MGNRERRTYDSGLYDGGAQQTRSRMDNNEAYAMLFENRGSMSPPHPGRASQPGMPSGSGSTPNMSENRDGINVDHPGTAMDAQGEGGNNQMPPEMQQLFESRLNEYVSPFGGPAGAVPGNADREQYANEPGPQYSYPTGNRAESQYGESRPYRDGYANVQHPANSEPEGAAGRIPEQTGFSSEEAARQQPYMQQYAGSRQYQEQAPAGAYANPLPQDGRQMPGYGFTAPAYGAEQPRYSPEQNPSMQQYAGSRQYQEQAPAGAYANPFPQDGRQMPGYGFAAPAYGAGQPQYPGNPQYADPYQSEPGPYSKNPYDQTHSSRNPYQQYSQEDTGYTYGSLAKPRGNENIFSKRVISVYSPKGGAGKTSVSKELACTFVRDDAKINGRKPRVLLVDLDFSYADLYTVFNISSSPNIMGWISLMRRDIQTRGSIPAYDKRTIDQFIRKNIRPGLDLLVGPPSSMDAKLITEEMTSAICSNLRACDYDIIIYDNAPSSEEKTLRIIEQSDEVVVLCTLDTTTCTEMGDFFRIERERSFDASKFKLVINKIPTNAKHLDITPGDITALYDIVTIGNLPEDDMLRIANNDARSLMLDGKETAYVREMKQVAGTLVPVFKEEKKSLFQRLFKKK